MAKRDAVFPKNPHALFEMHRYSPGVRANGLLFTAGHVGARADGSPEPEIEPQIRLALRNLIAVLEAAGCSFADVVDVTIFMVDPERNMEAMMTVLPEIWGDPPFPPVAVIGATWLAGFDFEIKVIAKLPEASE